MRHRELYNSQFFKKSLKDSRMNSYKTIAQYLFDTFQPNSVIDFGCGCGWILHFLVKKGVAHYLGIEGSESIKLVQTEPIIDHIRFEDLGKPFQIEEQFDLAICTEVAEHIDEDQADTFLDNICRNSNTLVISIAPPQQGGTGHVNKWLFSSWGEKLNNHLFFEDEEASIKFRRYLKERRVNKWYRNNMRIFKREV